MEKTSWEKLEAEQLNTLISRQMLSAKTQRSHGSF
jgi:hypothetical protein